MVLLLIATPASASPPNQLDALDSSRATQVHQWVIETKSRDLQEVTLRLTEELSAIEGRIAIFEFVRDWKYRISVFRPRRPEDILLTERGDCRHKAALLTALFEYAGYEVRKVKVICDYADLPIPAEILQVRGVTTDVHDAIQLKVDTEWVYIDATWNAELQKLGFPVTTDWNGVSPTRMVTNGSVMIVNEFDEMNMESFFLKHSIQWPERQKNRQFVKDLNAWLDNVDKRDMR